MKDAPGASSSADAPSVVTAELSDADLRAEGKAEEERLLDGSDGQRVGSHCPRLADVLKIAVYIAAYLTIGPTLILVNRSLMKTHGFNYPMALSGLGLLFSTLVSFLLVHCCKLVSLPNRELVTAGFYVRNLLPVGAAMAGTLAAGNAVYLYLPVGFIQMLKAFTPSVTLALLWATRIEVPTWPVCGAVVGICLGTAIASAGEASLNLFGLGLMLLAELCEATRLVLVQKLLNNLKFGVIEGQYFMAPISALWLFAAAAVHELPRAVHSENAVSVPLSHPALFAASATLGFAVNIATFLVIKATSSITLKVLGTARNAGLVLWSAYMLGESISRLELAGYSISLTAFAAYNYFKFRKL